MAIIEGGGDEWNARYCERENERSVRGSSRLDENNESQCANSKSEHCID